MIKKGMFSVSLCWEAMVLFLICAADLLLTSVVLTFGGSESNPIMKAILEWGGISSLVLIKLLWLYMAIFLMESARVGNISFGKKTVLPQRIKKYYYVGIVAYILLFGVGLVVVNF
jgi:hypothetical protein